MTAPNTSVHPVTRGLIISMLVLIAWPAQADPPSLTALLRPHDARTLPTLLDDDHPLTAGLSMGRVNDGWLHDAVTVPFNGDILAVIPPNRARERNYGAATLVRLLNDTARALDTPGAPRLMLGDLAAARGGRISHHSSHQSGRDADLAFYYLDEHGQPVEADAFYSVDPDGWAEVKHDDGTVTRLRFDVARNWALIHAMMTHPEIDLQYVLIATHLKTAMLEHAQQRGDDPRMIERARWLVIQPWNSAPHDDHMHIRVFCGPRDRVEGCIERPPAWPWARQNHAAVSAVTTRLIEGLRVQPHTAQAVIPWALDRHLDIATPGLLTMALAHQGPAREAWLAAVDTLGPTAGAGAQLSMMVREHPKPGWSHVASLLGQLQRPRWTGALARELTLALGEGRWTDVTVVLEALHPLASRRVIPMLLTLLEHHHGSIRHAALAQLEALTFHRDRRWRPKHAQRVIDLDAVNRWRAWWRTHHQQTATDWLALGLRDAGLNVRSMDDVAAIETLIEAQKVAPRPLAHAAHHLLVQRTRFRGVKHTLSPRDRHTRWRRWWDSLTPVERTALGQPPPQPRGPWLMTSLDTW